MLALVALAVLASMVARRGVVVGWGLLGWTAVVALLAETLPESPRPSGRSWANCAWMRAGCAWSGATRAAMPWHFMPTWSSSSAARGRWMGSTLRVAEGEVHGFLGSKPGLTPGPPLSQPQAPHVPR